MPRKPYVPPACHCGIIRQTARRVTRIYDHHLASVGLRASQFAVLRAIWRHAPTTVQGLAEVSIMNRTTMSRAPRPLERTGFVRLTSGSDARTHIVELTSEGHSLLDRAVPAWQRAQAEFERRFGSEETSGLRAQLMQVVVLMA